MAKATFMSMKWLRLHIKEIIWATVILFVSSIFVIGYGTSRAIRAQEERDKANAKAERDAAAAKNAIPANLQDKINLPVVHLSYPTANASLTTIIDLKTVWRSIKDSPEYIQLANMPEGIKKFYGDMIKERAVDGLITQSLIQLYAQANNIKPPVTPDAIVQKAKQQISPVEFARNLRKQGLSEKEFGIEKLKEFTVQSVAQNLLKPVPVASATDAVLRKYYEDNKIRFREDDEVTFNHLVIEPSDFVGKVDVTDDQVKSYFDSHRNDFVSSKRVSVSHIYINPKSEDFIATIPEDENRIRKVYTENASKYKTPEKVSARHILIKPKNNFDYDFPSFKINLRNFAKKDHENMVLYTFDAGISGLSSSSHIKLDNFCIETDDGQSFYPTSDSLALTEGALELPISGSPKPAVSGTIAILVNKDLKVAKLQVKDGGVVNNFDVSSSFDTEAAYAAAKKEAEELLARIKNNNEDFATLAKEFSQDPGSAKKGGDLGEFGRGAMVKPFEEAAFATKIGDITEPVRTQFGYHIIKVEGKTAEKTKSLDEVRAEISAEIRAEQASLKASASLETAKQKAIHQNEDFAKSVKMISMGASRKNDGKLPVFFKGEITDDYSVEQRKILFDEIGGNGYFIDPKIEKAVFALDVNEISDVIETENGFHLFKMIEKLEPVQLALTESLKTKIRKIIEEDKQKQMAEKAANDLIANNKGASFDKLVKAYKKDDKELKTKIGPLPFSKSPGFSSYALSEGLGKFSMDGRTYLPEIHSAIMMLQKDGNWKNKVVGPIKSELGYHFVELLDYQGDKYQPFEEIKSDLFKMVTLEPTEEDIQKAFEANKDKLDKPATRQLRQIVVSDEKTASELYKRLQQGEIFYLLAKTYSIDGSASQGGKIPAIKRGQLSPELDKAVWNLKKGQYTKPIKTAYGYVIALLDADETPGVKATLTPEVRNSLKRQIKQEYSEKTFTAFLKGLRNQAHVIRHPQVLAEL